LYEYRKSITLKITHVGVTFFMIGVGTVIFAISHGATLTNLKLLFPCIGYAVAFLFVAVVFLFQRVDKNGRAVAIPFEPEKPDPASSEFAAEKDGNIP
jgi:hypothetical protein